MAAILFLSFLLLIVIGVPISFALVLAAFLAITAGTPLSSGMIIQKLFQASNTFPLVAIPLFILAGGIMSKGSMADKLIELAKLCVGRLKGGMGAVSVAASMFFAAISGSTAATTAAIGTVLIPAMIDSGFSRGSATSLQTTAGAIGIVIPPSIPCILMGVILEGASIDELFMAGIVPGVLIGLFLMVLAVITGEKGVSNEEIQQKSFSDIMRLVFDASVALATIVWVLGGIILGLVTATEAAIIAVLYALFVELVYYRELEFSQLTDVFINTVKITGIVVICIGAAEPFSWLMTYGQIPEAITSFVLNISNQHVFLKVYMFLCLLITGMFLDLTPAMLLLVPILLPISQTVGLDPVAFGIFVVTTLAIGQCTPPVGISLFVACSISNVRIEEMILPMIPFLLGMVAVVILMLFIPDMVTIIPEVLLAS